MDSMIHYAAYESINDVFVDIFRSYATSYSDATRWLIFSCIIEEKWWSLLILLHVFGY